MKSLLTICLIITHFTMFAQTIKIEKLLNKQFKKEQKMYEEGDENKPILLKEYQITNDTLSFSTVQILNNGVVKLEKITSKVHLKDIVRFDKDINIIFISKPDAVSIVKEKLDKSGNALNNDKVASNMFFTELNKDKKDRVFQRKILKAFKKAGYPIVTEYWQN